MEIVVETWLDAPPERVRALCLRPETLVHVSAPLLHVVPVGATFPDIWEDGMRCEAKLRLFGVVPLGRQTIAIVRTTDPESAEVLRDAGHGTLARRWDHRIALREDGAGTRYTDRVDIEAGPLTPVVAGFARLYYRHRQRRWHRLIAGGGGLPPQARQRPSRRSTS